MEDYIRRMMLRELSGPPQLSYEGAGMADGMQSVYYDRPPAGPQIPQTAGDEGTAYEPWPMPGADDPYPGIPDYLHNAARVGDVMTAGGVTAYGQGVSPLDHFGDTVDRTLETGAMLTSEFSGVPNMMRGGEAIRQGYQDDNNAQMAGGAAQAGLSAVPVVGPAARFAFSSAPRAMATMGSMGAAPVFASGMFGGPSQAQAQDKMLESLYAQQQSLTSALEEARRVARDEGKSGRGPRYNAAMERVGQLESKMNLLGERIAKQEERNTPEAIAQREREQRAAEANTGFRERFPELTALLPAAGVGLAAGIPFAGRSMSNLSSWMPYSNAGRLNRAIERTDKAIKSGDSMQASLGAKTLDEQVALIGRSTPTTQGEVGRAVAAGGSGGMLTAEANMFPDQYDAAMLRQGSPEQIAARERALDVQRYLKTGMAGTLSGISGYKAADLATKPWSRKPDIARAKATSQIASEAFPGQIDRVKNSLAAASGKLPKAKPAAKRKPAQAQEGAKFNKAEREQIADKYVANGGNFSIEDAQSMFPKVPRRKLERFVRQLDEAKSDVKNLKALRRFVDKNIIAGAAGATVAAGAMSEEEAMKKILDQLK